jgi:hypothetical protein
MWTFLFELYADDVLAMVSYALPPFEENFCPHAYISWELKVDVEFGKYKLSEHQMILAAASALTKYTLSE